MIGSQVAFAEPTSPANRWLRRASVMGAVLLMATTNAVANGDLWKAPDSQAATAVGFNHGANTWPLLPLLKQVQDRSPESLPQPENAPSATPPAQTPGGPPGAQPQQGLEPPFKGKPYADAFGDKFPSTARERSQALANLYAFLATAPDEAMANEVATIVEQLWQITDSDTISLLMERSMVAVRQKQLGVALKLLDTVVELKPDYAEGWNRRAFVYFLSDELTSAVGDLRRTLALEPNHFKALQGLAQILVETDEKKSALDAYRKVIEIHPFAAGAEDSVRKLELEVEGQKI